MEILYPDLLDFQRLEDLGLKHLYCKESTGSLKGEVEFTTHGLP